MGAKISYEHDPDQLQAVRDAEDAVMKHYGADKVAKEEWLELELPESGGVDKLIRLRVWKVGETDDKSSRLVLFLHGGGDIATKWAPVMPLLLDSQLKGAGKTRFWFVDMPGHGVSPPFDYRSVEHALDQFTASWIDGVRQAAGVETMDLVGSSLGGTCAYYYARRHTCHLRSLTWIGAPALFVGQSLPWIFYLISMPWIGAQLMAKPASIQDAKIILFDFGAQDPECVPDCYVELYRSFLSLHNNMLSFHSILRVVMKHRGQYKWDLKQIGQTLGEGGKMTSCHLVVGAREKLIKQEQLNIVQEQIGRAPVIVGQGHEPWLEDAPGVVAELVNILAS